MRMISTKVFQKMFHRLLEERHMNVKEIADYLSISQQAVYRWLHGETIPSIDTMLCLADLFSLEVADLIPVVELPDKEH